MKKGEIDVHFKLNKENFALKIARESFGKLNERMQIQEFNMTYSNKSRKKVCA